jgi:hypothetical protein
MSYEQVIHVMTPLVIGPWALRHRPYQRLKLHRFVAGRVDGAASHEVGCCRLRTDQSELPEDPGATTLGADLGDVAIPLT